MFYAGDPARRRQFHAVTIVNVGSVDFEPYIRLLLGPVGGLRAVDHLVVITDRDPVLEGMKGSRGPEPDRRALQPRRPTSARAGG